MRKQSVAVVSNNNAAIENVINKLEKNDLGFITALLGNQKNKTEFIDGQSGKYPDMDTWVIEKEERKSISGKIHDLIAELNKKMRLQKSTDKEKKEGFLIKPAFSGRVRNLYLNIRLFLVRHIY